MTIPRSVIVTAAGVAVLAGSTVIASVVFVAGAGLWPAYKAAGGASVLWAWWSWIGYDGVRADVAQRWLEIGAVSPALLGVALWLLWRRFRAPVRQTLYGETEWAAPTEMKRAGFSLKRHPRL